MDDEGSKYEQKMTLHKIIVAVVLLVAGRSTPASIGYDPNKDYSVNRLLYKNDDQQIYTCRICDPPQSSFNHICQEQNKHVVSVYGRNTQPFCTSGHIPNCPRPAQPAIGEITVKTDRRVYRWRENVPVYSPQILTCPAGYLVRGLSVVWCSHTTAKGSTTAAAWNESLGICELELVTKTTPKRYTTAAVNDSLLKVTIAALGESHESSINIGIITGCVVLAGIMVGIIIFCIRFKRNRRQNGHFELASNVDTSITNEKTAGKTDIPECTPLTVDIPNDTDGGENNSLALNDDDGITSDSGIDIKSNDCIDITNNDRVDNTNNDRVDNTNNDRVDNPNNDRVDITSNDHVDITNNDRVDITSNDHVDITSNDHVDITNNDRVDITNNDRVDITSNDRVDITNNNRVDITRNDRVDILSNDRGNITSNDLVDITSNDRVDITSNDHVDIMNNDRVDITNNDRVDITNNDRVDITNNDRVDITTNDRVDITNNDRVDITNNNRVDITSNDHGNITSNDSQANMNNEANNRKRIAAVRPMRRGMTEQTRQAENEMRHVANSLHSLTENAFGTRLY